jgi:hypothetical protein
VARSLHIYARQDDRSLGVRRRKKTVMGQISARTPAVVSSGGWAVYDVADAGILCGLFAASWTRYLNNVANAGRAQSPL